MQSIDLVYPKKTLHDHCRRCLHAVDTHCDFSCKAPKTLSSCKAP